MTGISRKLPETERPRLKSVLKKVVPEDAGVIVRTASEGASEEELSRDVAAAGGAVGRHQEEVGNRIGRPDAALLGAGPHRPGHP